MNKCENHCSFCAQVERKIMLEKWFHYFGRYFFLFEWNDDSFDVRDGRFSSGTNVHVKWKGWSFAFVSKTGRRRCTQFQNFTVTDCGQIADTPWAYFTWLGVKY